MPGRRLLSILALLGGLAAILYVAISFFVPSPRRLILGVDKRTGRIRHVDQSITFLPPNRYYRLSFEKREGAAQRDGVITMTSREGVPVKINYRIRFGINQSRLPDARRLVAEGWTAWLNARVAEAVSAVIAEVGIEELASPVSQFARQRETLAQTVSRHLADSGLNVSFFAIQRIDIDRPALLQYKRNELRRNARGPLGRVAVFALDGADWELLSELMQDGRMPNLRALTGGGTTASVQTIQPTAAPLVWSTVATGLPPDRHGVVDFFTQDPSRAPVDASSRRVPAVWEIATAFGRPSQVVSWWGAWPTAGETITFGTPIELRSSAIRPASLQPIVAENLTPEGTIGHQQIRRFLNISEAEFQRAINAGNASDPIVLFRSILAKTWTDHRVALAIYDQSSPLLMMISYEGTDAVNHLFGPYHPPYRQGIASDAFRKFWPAVANYYSEIDRLLGEWTAVLPQDTTVMIVSGYGMKWGRDRPREPPAGASALPDHRNLGALVLFGNRVAPSARRHLISIYDVAPTILTILGLPVAREMPGRFFAAGFSDVEAIDGVSVTSYSEIIAPPGPRSGVEADRGLYRARLQEIGHVVDPTRSEPQLVGEAAISRQVPPGSERWGLYAWHNNQGVELRRKQQLREAADAFARAIELNPERPVAYLNLAMVLYDRQQYTAAETLFFRAIEKGLPSPENYLIDFAALYRQNDMPTRAINVLVKGRELLPESFVIVSNLGSVLAEADRYTDAVTELERALAMRPTSTSVLNNLALIHLHRKEYARALDYWNRSLVIDPRQPHIRQAVMATQSRM
ncbi:MAG TPA: alkaline phosphatase family protein [Thermoanaerobaculia bacterium]|nr:alkaline phosphatase family protein [Thermoanaerobaculia bacterium]